MSTIQVVLGDDGGGVFFCVCSVCLCVIDERCTYHCYQLPKLKHRKSNFDFRRREHRSLQLHFVVLFFCFLFLFSLLSTTNLPSFSDSSSSCICTQTDMHTPASSPSHQKQKLFKSSLE